MKTIDLHMHTTLSDGTLTPDELMEEARSAGLDIISITDHDTLTSSEEIKRLAADNKITLIPGVEFSTVCLDIPVHILAYFVDRNSKPVMELLEKAKGSRHDRNVEMLELLKQKGIEITWEELREVAGSDVIARPHFAQLLVQKDIVRTKQQAFQDFLADNAPCCPKRVELPSEEVIEAVNRSGGISCLAHPSIYGLKKEEDYIPFLAELKKQGMNALEVYNSKHDEKKAAFFLKLAERFDFLPLGGSDFHGANKLNVDLGKFYGVEKVFESLEPELKLRGYA